MEGHFNLGFGFITRKNMLPPRKSGPFSMPWRISRTQEITKVNFLQQMGKQKLGGMGRKGGQKLCQWHIASWPIEEWSFPGLLTPMRCPLPSPCTKGAGNQERVISFH